MCSTLAAATPKVCEARGVTHSALQAFALLAVAVATLGCGSVERREPVQWTDEQAAQLLAGMDANAKATNSFARDHPHKEVNSLAFIKRLQQEGFVCAIRHYNNSYYSDGKGGEPFGIRSRREPSVSCERNPDASPDCKWFRVFIVPSWSDLGAPFRLLASQLSSTKVVEALFVCHVDSHPSARRGGKDADVAAGEILVTE